MCVPIHHQHSVRNRVLLAIANLALAAGIALPYLVHVAGTSKADWLDASRGLLIGMSISMNFLLIRQMRSCRRIATDKSSS